MGDDNRVMPNSELDLHFLTTETVWGKPEVSPELKEKLERLEYTKHSDGTVSVDSKSLWDLLSFYTRDMRLGNLSEWNGELQYCQYYLDLAHDLLESGYNEPFIICLSRVASILELSQSKRGFLRRNMNTLRTEHMQGELEPPKKRIMGYGGGRKE